MVRKNNRLAGELRSLKIIPDYISYPEGSVLIEAGNTQVICNVTIEENVPKWMLIQGKKGGWVTAEYAMLPRSTHTRNARETIRPRGRTQEISRLIGRSLRSAINLEDLDGLTCIVDCDVIQADGGTRTASITGGYVALVLALADRIKAGELSRSILKTTIAAVSVGVLEQTPMLDLCYEEDQLAEVDMNVVFDEDMNFIEIQGTGEKNTFSRKMLNKLLDLVETGCGDIISTQKKVLRSKYPNLVE